MTLTRGIVAPGITEGQHERLDTLTHKIVESSFIELTYTGKDLTSVIVWTSAAKILKIREAALSYTGRDLTEVAAEQYDGTGTLLVTLIKTLTYTGEDLTSVTVVRT